MRIYILIKSRNRLPNINDLVSVMWDTNISFSHIADSTSLSKCTVLTLSWDKWVDDKRWEEHSKYREHIEFKLPKKLINFSAPIIIEVADDAVFVDIRAFHKAALYIAEKADGKISLDGINWLEPKRYLELIKEYLECTFKEAVDISLL